MTYITTEENEIRRSIVNGYRVVHTYRRGKKNGKSLYFDNKGYIVATESYLNDVLNGITETYAHNKMRVSYRIIEGVIESITSRQWAIDGVPIIVVAKISNNNISAMSIEFTDTNTIYDLSHHRKVNTWYSNESILNTEDAIDVLDWVHGDILSRKGGLHILKI